MTLSGVTFEKGTKAPESPAKRRSRAVLLVARPEGPRYARSPAKQRLGTGKTWKDSSLDHDQAPRCSLMW